MNVEQAMVEVCQRFCSTSGDAHDDACVALREAVLSPPFRVAEANRLRAKSAEARLQAVVALADRADARADVDRRLVTTATLRAALGPS